MNIFPAQYSTLCSRALGKELAKKYHLNDYKCRLLIRNVSDTYLLETAKDKYIFKIYRDNHRKLEEIKGEIALLNLLKRHGASVSYPVSDIEENQLQPFHAAEGLRWGVMFTYAKGEIVNNMSESQLRTAGREMAKIHAISSRIQIPFKRKEYSLDTMIRRPLKTLKPAFINLPAEYDYLQQTADSVLKNIQEFDLDSFAYGYCHYDFLPKNFHFDTEGNVIFFDFDFAGPGHLVNDITSFCAHYFLEVYYHKISRETARKAINTFLSAYSETKKITADEKRAIPYFGFAWWLFYLGFQYESYDDWSNIFFNDRFIKARVELMKQWMEEPLYIG